MLLIVKSDKQAHIHSAHPYAYIAATPTTTTI